MIKVAVGIDVVAVVLAVIALVKGVSSAGTLVLAVELLLLVCFLLQLWAVGRSAHSAAKWTAYLSTAAGGRRVVGDQHLPGVGSEPL
jgi:hypothetical protein